MAILVPDAAINAELQETVSRASIRRMIQAGSGILTAGSDTQQNQRVAQAQAAGIEPSPDNPLFVGRTDLGVILSYDGTTWSDMSIGDDTGWRQLDLIGEWVNSNAQARKIRNQVFMRGVLTRSSPLPNNSVANPFSSGYPPQFRPPNLVRLSAAADNGGTPNWGYQVTVYLPSDGGLRILNKSGSEVTNVSLYGVTYLAD